MKKKMGRPPKTPEERKQQGMRIPLTDDEKSLVERVAEATGEKPVTWARAALLKAARRQRKAGESNPTGDAGS